MCAVLLLAVMMFAVPAFGQTLISDTASPGITQVEFEGFLQSLDDEDARAAALAQSLFDEYHQNVAARWRDFQNAIASAQSEHKDEQDALNAACDILETAQKAAAAALLDRFESDVATLLPSPDALDAWSTTTRNAWRRRVLHDLDPYHSHAVVVDLALVLAELELPAPEDDTAAVGEAITAYHHDLDAVLQEAERSFAAIAADTQGTAQQHAAVFKDFVQKVYETNQRFQPQIMQALTAFHAQQFEMSLILRRESAVFAGTPVDAIVARVHELELMSGTQLAEFEAIYAVYVAQRGEQRARLLSSISEWKEHLGRDQNGIPIRNDPKEALQARERLLSSLDRAIRLEETTTSSMRSFIAEQSLQISDPALALLLEWDTVSNVAR
ncbi:MAG: hypothetical protein ACR2GY_08440 [Phycisphaerales bacterium]